MSRAGTVEPTRNMPSRWLVSLLLVASAMGACGYPGPARWQHEQDRLSLAFTPTADAYLTIVNQERCVTLTRTGASVQLVATLWTHGSTADVTSRAAWRSSDPRVADITTVGAVTALRAGTSWVSARVERFPRSNTGLIRIIVQ